ncbi:MgtC/SapB family protein [Anaerobranca gottschalkii]|uniref:Putative Mg2+ transporter-C (MgtC) family protein n=1 Tax=Anaerobranca gottschalkii DSM 13577 TaxID=1120990 RepID=A0A1I0C7Y0_9FIRM|nr:MgtC/SapB family protein [Anaerobranca gottschalkii]SET15463.1 putative Mg2+ transporter-C (MgtC) family protein [Anaerobranca gottschalkii DSM 13577]
MPQLIVSEQLDFVVRLFLAFIFGGIIGFERQKRQRMAGMRTNVLVSLGAFLFVTLSMMIEGEGSPTRMAAQVVSGIGFLGAGVIIRDGLNVRGLNTAATLWCAAAIGVLTSAGFILEAFLGTIFVLIANIYLRTFIKKVEGEIPPSTTFETNYVLRVVCTEKSEFHIRALLLHMMQEEDLMLNNLSSEDLSHDLVEVIAKLTSLGKNHLALEKIASRISLETGIKSVGWEFEG